jgi:hypothetical protein
MTNEPDGLRERIREAIAQPVAEAEKLLSELTDVDRETKLSILISGWGRGLAAALEELAIAIDELRPSDTSREPEPAPAAPLEAAHAQQVMPDEPAHESARADTADHGDERLLDEAKKSREATAELRREAEQVGREVEP